MAEDYTTYTEVDVGADRVTVNNASLITITDLDDDEAVWVYKDYGEDYFDDSYDWRFEFGFKCTSGGDRCGIWSLTQDVEGIRYLSTNNKNFLAVEWVSTDKLQLEAYDAVGGGGFSWTDVLDTGTDYYARIDIDWSGSQVNLYVYSDAARLNLVDSTYVGFNNANYYQYLFAMHGYDDAAGGGDAYDGQIWDGEILNGPSSSSSSSGSSSSSESSSSSSESSSSSSSESSSSSSSGSSFSSSCSSSSSSGSSSSSSESSSSSPFQTADIAGKFCDSDEMYFLVELDFDGWVQRFSTKNIAVPNEDGDDLFFQGLIMNSLSMGSSIDLYSLRQSISSVSISIANKMRFQDNEKQLVLDNGIGRIWAWTEGLDWVDIEERPIFIGTFRKDRHDKFSYDFELVDLSESKFKQLPFNIVDDSTFATHRKEGGGGSVSGLPQPMVFGDWPKGVPLLCVDTAGFRYLAGVGVVDSTEADYDAAAEYVWDKDGATIATANYVFYPSAVDAQGNLISDFDFTGDQAASEPLSCSIRGLTDGSGEYTGTAGSLLEHPADIVHYLLRLYTNFDMDEISVETLKTMRSLLPGYKFATIINDFVAGVDVIDRIFNQCQCVRIQRNGRIGSLTIDLSGVETGRIHKFNLVGRTVSVGKTPYASLCNNLRVFYAFNPTTGNWEGQFVLNRENNPDCEKSYYDYGEQPLTDLQLIDVQLEFVARACAGRYIAMRAFRHDVVECNVTYCDGWDVLEGDVGLLTVEEGPSLDGNGWIDERFILLEKKYMQGYIQLRWWRIGVD